MYISSFIAEGYRNYHLSRGTSVAAHQLRTRMPAFERMRRTSAANRDGQCKGWQEVSVAKEDRGFASMDRAKQREIASKGGKAAHQKGTAHEWTSEEAREAGRKGGMASHRRRSELTGSQMTGESMQNLESSDMSERDDESNEQIR